MTKYYHEECDSLFRRKRMKDAEELLPILSVSQSLLKKRRNDKDKNANKNPRKFRCYYRRLSLTHKKLIV